MKRQNKKRGFTIIELVIVIAVIAILSAVLIPTFSSVIKKSRQSADESAVRNMNTILAAEGAVEPTTLDELYDALQENGISAENYKPLYSNRYFFWDASENKIVYTDSEYNVLYPKDQVGNTDRNDWFSLSGTISDVDVDDVDIEGNTASVKSAGEFVAVLNALGQNDKEVKNVSNITLVGEVNLMGAQFEIESVKKELTIGAADATKPATIKGLVDNTAIDEKRNASGSAERIYMAGMIGEVKSTVTFENLIIDNANVGSADASQVGVLVGRVVSGGKVVIKNVKISNTTVTGLQKVGGLVGHIQGGGSVTVEDTTMTNVTVKATMGMAGGLFGYLQKGTITFDDAKETLGDTKVELAKVSTGHYINYERTEDGLLDKTIAADLNDDLTIASLYAPKINGVVVETGCYRYFATCAKYGFVYGGSTYAETSLTTGYQNKGVVFAYNAKAAATTSNSFTVA